VSDGNHVFCSISYIVIVTPLAISAFEWCIWLKCSKCAFTNSWAIIRFCYF